METLRGDEHDLGSVYHLHRAQARGVLEHFAFADKPLAAGEDVGERLEEALQLRGGRGGRYLHGDGPPGELDLDGDGGRRALHGLCRPDPPQATTLFRSMKD